MDEKPKLARKHSLDMENREKARITGVNDVISFDLENVLLETDYGMMTIHGDDLHVRRLSVEKGEVEHADNVGVGISAYFHDVGDGACGML